MPEGDTVFRAASALRKALLGKPLLRFESAVIQAATRASRQPLHGRMIAAIEPRGKHLLMVFRLSSLAPQADNGAVINTDENQQPERSSEPIHTSPGLNLELLDSDLVLHTHMRMTGSWHIYRPGEMWRKPAKQASVVLYTADFVAPCFNAPVVELLTARETSRHPQLNALGPDAITPAFDEVEALERLQRRGDTEVAVALLDQKILAGVGNVYKSEVLFIRRLSPFLKVKELDESVLQGLIAESHRLLQLNTERGSRRTMFGLNEHDRLWVYGRSGEPCRDCGEAIRMRRQGLDARSTYFCPQCQAVAAHVVPVAPGRLKPG